jgi:3'-phosphoadenosine 5'-phosphosulfate sulfotransferase (PAPS reductase)/FAD synthetase
LDPFGGAGTTGLVADRLQRDAILIELNPEYAEMARKRITNDAPLFAEVMNVISSSYGNDSVALMQWAKERSLPDVTVAYCNTGWAAPGLARHARPEGRGHGDAVRLQIAHAAARAWRRWSASARASPATGCSSARPS